MVGRCKLCLTYSELKNSHIIPEFLYKPIYDEDGKALVPHSSDEYHLVTEGLKQHLLCGKCETQFSKYETYAKPIVANILASEPTEDLLTYQNVDYKLFKLFEMSMLWRMSISSNPMFANVNIGQKHEERLRASLSVENPRNYYEYGCVVAAKLRLEYSRQYVGNIILGTHNSHHYLMVSTGGIEWTYFISSHTKSIESIFHMLFIKPDNILNVFPYLETDEKHDLSQLARRIRNS